MRRGIFTQKGVSPLKADENKNVFQWRMFLCCRCFGGLVTMFFLQWNDDAIMQKKNGKRPGAFGESEFFVEKWYV